MKTSLVINSKNPNLDWLNQAIESAKGFDEIVLYIDGTDVPEVLKESRKDIKFVSDGKSRNIGEGLNFAIAQSIGDWICPFCDDDYFHSENLTQLIEGIKNGDYQDFDVVHGLVSLDNGGLWGASQVTINALRQNNIIPFSSFYKREVFDSLKGYSETVGAYNDWNFWLRAAKAEFRFKFYGKLLYHFRQGHNSATNRLLKSVGGHWAAAQEVLANA